MESPITRTSARDGNDRIFIVSWRCEAAPKWVSKGSLTLWRGSKGHRPLVILSRHVEGEDGGEVVLLAGAEHGIDELGVVDGIGGELGLEAEALVGAIDAPGAAGIQALEVVGGVELHGGHVGEHVHHAAGLGIGDLDGEAQAGLEVIDVEVVVDASFPSQVSEGSVLNGRLFLKCHPHRCRLPSHRAALWPFQALQIYV